MKSVLVFFDQTLCRMLFKRVGAVLLLLVFVSSHAQSPCTDGQAPNLLTQWKNSTTIAHSNRPGLTKQGLSEASSRMNKIAPVLMKAYPQPRGLEAHMRRSIDGEGEHEEYRAELAGAAAPLRYSTEAWFFTLNCDTQTGKVAREGETGTQIIARVNWLRDFMEPIDEAYGGLKLPNGQKMYFMPYVVGNLKDYPVYSTQKLTWDMRRQESVVDANRVRESILITRYNRLPVRSVSREEYIRAQQRGEEARFAEVEANMKKFETLLNASLAEYDKMAFASETEREKAKAGARKEVEIGRKTMTKDRDRHRQNVLKLDALIQELSEKERSAQAVISDPHALVMAFDMAAELKMQEQKGRPLVTHDFSYGDAKAPRHAIQYIQLFFKYETLSRLIAKPEMIRQVKENIDLDALSALLGS